VPKLSLLMVPPELKMPLLVPVFDIVRVPAALLMMPVSKLRMPAKLLPEL